MFKSNNQKRQGISIRLIRQNAQSYNVLNYFLIAFLLSIFSYSSASFANERIVSVNTKVNPIRPIKGFTPTSVEKIVYSRPFSLNTSYTHHWRQEKPRIRFGTLVVFKVNPKLVRPRNAAEPVLYVGNQTAERLNHGYESGHVIAIVPGHVDFNESPAWFGRPELPERVNEKIIATERALAERAGIKPLSPKAVIKKKPSPLRAVNLADLLREHVAELVLKYSPAEKELANAWRLPVATR